MVASSPSELPHLAIIVVAAVMVIVGGLLLPLPLPLSCTASFSSLSWLAGCQWLLVHWWGVAVVVVVVVVYAKAYAIGRIAAAAATGIVTMVGMSLGMELWHKECGNVCRRMDLSPVIGYRSLISSIFTHIVAADATKSLHPSRTSNPAPAQAPSHPSSSHRRLCLAACSLWPSPPPLAARGSTFTPTPSQRSRAAMTWHIRSTTTPARCVRVPAMDTDDTVPRRIKMASAHTATLRTTPPPPARGACANDDNGDDDTAMDDDKNDGGVVMMTQQEGHDNGRAKSNARRPWWGEVNHEATTATARQSQPQDHDDGDDKTAVAVMTMMGRLRGWL
ncbi:hypothetical protein EDB89DRAFT_1915508 [Lactarius sanguifluus]|nr:hypothetical protein EDB89DRAFT_1915508 [Lactarius sanguifluus]